MRAAMAKLHMPPIPYRMYRHFAVATVTLTACVAMFADGERREAISDHIEHKEREAELQRQSEAMFGQRELVRSKAAEDDGEFGSESSDFAMPSDDLGGRITRLPPRRERRPEIPGYSRTYVDSLTEEQYRALLASIAQGAGETQAEREQNLRNLDRMSRLRSGADAGEE